MTICATGHRPPALGGYSKDVLRALIAVADTYLEEHPPELVISGMALGWDTAIAIAAIRRKIKLKGYIPFQGQDARWPAESRQRYRKILGRCESTVIACPHGYSPDAMQFRNQLMVDDSELVVALWNGGEQGGTWNCVRYAREQGREIVNLWEKYEGVRFEI
jgi:uncharacterized phage-like protein YoqJ